MSNKLTYTGTIGPGTSVTTLVFDQLQNLNIDYYEQTITVRYNGRTNTKEAIISLSGVTTLTYTISGGEATITAS